MMSREMARPAPGGASRFIRRILSISEIGMPAAAVAIVFFATLAFLIYGVLRGAGWSETASLAGALLAR
jgi:hypothetical protein